MRQEKRLKRWMKEYLAARGLNVDNWRYISFTPPNRLIIIHKHSLQPREVGIKEEGQKIETNIRCLLRSENVLVR